VGNRAECPLSTQSRHCGSIMLTATQRNMMASAGEWEPVFTVNEFWDGARRGFANYAGRPHAYSCEWNEQGDDWGAVYLLSPITDEQLALAREDWGIWCRWVSAQKADRLTPEDKHPALAGDWPRHEELLPWVDEALAVDKSHAVRTVPEFRGRLELAGPLHDFEVRWHPA
jgi:hypothetical protein